MAHTGVQAECQAKSIEIAVSCFAHRALALGVAPAPGRVHSSRLQPPALPRHGAFGALVSRVQMGSPEPAGPAIRTLEPVPPASLTRVPPARAGRP